MSRRCSSLTTTSRCSELSALKSFEVGAEAIELIDDKDPPCRLSDSGTSCINDKGVYSVYSA